MDQWRAEAPARRRYVAINRPPPKCGNRCCRMRGSVIHRIRETRCSVNQLIHWPYKRHAQPLATAATKPRPRGQCDTTALKQFSRGIFITPPPTMGRIRQGEPEVHRHLWTWDRPTACPEGLNHSIPSFAIGRMQLLRPIGEALQGLDRTLLQSQALVEIDDGLSAT